MVVGAEFHPGRRAGRLDNRWLCGAMRPGPGLASNAASTRGRLAVPGPAPRSRTVSPCCDLPPVRRSACTHPAAGGPLTWPGRMNGWPASCWLAGSSAGGWFTVSSMVPVSLVEMVPRSAAALRSHAAARLVMCRYCLLLARPASSMWGPVGPGRRGTRRDHEHDKLSNLACLAGHTGLRGSAGTSRDRACRS